jgi:hypothetical protein
LAVALTGQAALKIFRILSKGTLRTRGLDAGKKTPANRKDILLECAAFADK